MTPLPGAVAAVTVEEAEVFPAPCSIHDDRLRELETEQAAHGEQLRAGSKMFESIQDSIKMLAQHVSESTERVEHTCCRIAEDVRGLSTQVSDMRVEQATQKVQLATISKDDSGLMKKARPYLVGAGSVGLVVAGAVGGWPAIRAVVHLLVGE